MNILFGGCSYCYGDELDDVEKERYSYFVSSELNALETNVSRGGNSNHKILYDLYDSIKIKQYDICVVGITYLYRFMMPGAHSRDKVRQINQITSNSTIYDKFASVIYSQSISDRSNWLYYYKNLFLMFDAACKTKDIKVFYTFVDEIDQIEFLKDQDLKHLNIICEPFKQFTKNNNYAIGNQKHPLQEAHLNYSKQIIKEIKNVL